MQIFLHMYMLRSVFGHLNTSSCRKICNINNWPQRQILFEVYLSAKVICFGRIRLPNISCSVGVQIAFLCKIYFLLVRFDIHPLLAAIWLLPGTLSLLSLCFGTGGLFMVSSECSIYCHSLVLLFGVTLLCHNQHQSASERE